MAEVDTSGGYEVTEPDPIPAIWLPALEAAPDDFVLRLALSDDLEERGDLLAAEALRWSAAKGRCPLIDALADTQWASTVKDNVFTPYYTPHRLLIRPPDYCERQSSVVWAFVRLIGKWKNSTPAERGSYWEWRTPTQAEQ